MLLEAHLRVYVFPSLCGTYYSKPLDIMTKVQIEEK